jgi:hypothetical protein
MLCYSVSHLPDYPGIGGNKDVIDIWHANDNTWSADKLASARSFFSNSAASLSAGLFFVAEGDTAGVVFISYSCTSLASAPSHGKELDAISFCWYQMSQCTMHHRQVGALSSVRKYPPP